MARTKKKKNKGRRFFRLSRLIGALALALVLFCAWNFFLPVISGLNNHNPGPTAFMELRQEQWQAKGLDRKIRQKWVPYASISPYLRQAVLIAEDDKFLSHDGFDWDMFQQALERNLESGQIKFGASTVTQQLAKNLYLSPKRSYVRKVREAIITLGLETFLDKERILELYLNVVEWGPGIFGAGAASRHYFGRSASRLTPWQAASLAATLPSPLRRNPAKLKGSAAARARRILAIMQKRGLGKIWR